MEDEFNVNIQTGKSEVSHKNLGAAGSDHPLGQDPLAFEANMRSLIRRVADDLYQSWEATIREYLANAETACLRVKEYVETGESTMFDGDLIVSDDYEPKIEVTWNRAENSIEIRDNGIGMSAYVFNEVFRKIGNTTSRDDGQYSGNFGQGVLSFTKIIGTDNSMLMTTHSRLTDENYSAYVSLAGPEPLMGTLPENEYGTKFQMTPKKEYDIRSAVEKFSEWMRVPVIYREFDDDGVETFNEDWGSKKLTDSYSDTEITISFESMSEYFKAYCSDSAPEETLLLSMPIERNSTLSKQPPFDVDIRILNESGPIIKSSNGNEGLVPIPRSDYEEMLIEERSPYITESLCNRNDTLGQDVAAGKHEGCVVVSEEAFEEKHMLPPNEYITPEMLDDSDEPGETRVIIGNNKGRIIVDESDWEEMESGRANMYVPEDEIEQYDLDSEEGDLQLPEPTGDRDRLQKNDVFWDWLAMTFSEKFEEMIYETHKLIEPTDDPIQTIANMDREDLVKSTINLGE